MTEEVRTTSATGGEKGVKLERYDLIPPESLVWLARLYGAGAQKYDDHNWRRGYEWSKSFGAMQRHAWQFWNGEDFDEETGVPHLANVAWHAFTLMSFMINHPDYDNRVSTVLERGSEVPPPELAFELDAEQGPAYSVEVAEAKVTTSGNVSGLPVAVGEDWEELGWTTPGSGSGLVRDPVEIPEPLPTYAEVDISTNEVVGPWPPVEWAPVQIEEPEPVEAETVQIDLNEIDPDIITIVPPGGAEELSLGELIDRAFGRFEPEPVTPFSDAVGRFFDENPHIGAIQAPEHSAYVDEAPYALPDGAVIKRFKYRSTRVTKEELGLANEELRQAVQRGLDRD